MQRDVFLSASVMTSVVKGNTLTANSIRGSMTRIVNIRGFTLDGAIEYVSNFIPEKIARDRFFRQLEKKNMAGMHKAPLMIQALALIFNEVGEEELPETITATFDYLILFLRRTCEGQEHLTKEKIATAIEEVNELAFMGLTRESRQLVFNREEIKNPDVFKLGVLTGEGAGNIKQKTVLQFPHKTVQEYHAAWHVATSLGKGDRGPWEKIKDLYLTKVKDAVNFLPVTKQTTLVAQVQHEETGAETQTLKNAITKLQTFLNSSANPDDVASNMLQMLIDGGFYDEQLNKSNLWSVLSNFLKNLGINPKLTDDEQNVFCEYIISVILATSVEYRRSSLNWANRAVRSGGSRITPVTISLKYALSVIAKDPEMAKELLLDWARLYEQDGFLANPDDDIIDILEDIQSEKVLFSFLAGKLAEKTGKQAEKTGNSLQEETAENILREIADLAIWKSVDSTTGDALPINLLETYLTDIVKEFKPQPPTRESRMSNPVCNSVCMIDARDEESPRNFKPPMIFHLNDTCGIIRRFTNTSEEIVKYHALKISGKADMNILPENSGKWISNINHIRLMEIEDLEIESCSQESCQVTNTLFKKPVSSLEMRDCGQNLMKQLANNLPESILRLSILHFKLNSIKVPAITQLKLLRLDGVLFNKDELFASDFPSLMKLSMTNVTSGWSSKPWQKDEIHALEIAMSGGRMPHLEDLTLECGSLQGWGKTLSMIMSEGKKLKKIRLAGTDLSYKDGQEILKAIKADAMKSIQLINLLHCPDISALAGDLKRACKPHNIELHITQPKKNNAPLSTLISSFLSQQTQHQSDEQFADAIRSILELVQPLEAQATGQVSSMTTDQVVNQKKSLYKDLSVD